MGIGLLPGFQLQGTFPRSVSESVCTISATQPQPIHDLVTHHLLRHMCIPLQHTLHQAKSSWKGVYYAIS
jgi:hypothetical protein